MVTTTRPRATEVVLDGPRPADVFVAFGITGDLAKVMTFRSLYRLEKRGVLDCPIVGVAVDDWSAADLREHRGPPAADDLIAGHGRWHELWVPA
jgi:glucose-6-phosphate 1-dehydrogenase